MHQHRKHVAHLVHPIVADRLYECIKQNKIFKEKFNLMATLLHTGKLVFEWDRKTIEIHASPRTEFRLMLNVLKLFIDWIFETEGGF